MQHAQHSSPSVQCLLMLQHLAEMSLTVQPGSSVPPPSSYNIICLLTSIIVISIIVALMQCFLCDHYKHFTSVNSINITVTFCGTKIPIIQMRKLFKFLVEILILPYYSVSYLKPRTVSYSSLYLRCLRTPRVVTERQRDRYRQKERQRKTKKFHHFMCCIYNLLNILSLQPNSKQFEGGSHVLNLLCLCNIGHTVDS